MRGKALWTVLGLGATAQHAEQEWLAAETGLERGGSAHREIDSIFMSSLSIEPVMRAMSSELYLQ